MSERLVPMKIRSGIQICFLSNEGECEDWLCPGNIGIFGKNRLYEGR